MNPKLLAVICFALGGIFGMIAGIAFGESERFEMVPSHIQGAYVRLDKRTGQSVLVTANGVPVKVQSQSGY